MISININSLEEMDDFAKKLSENLRDGEVYALRAGMGSGKTTLVSFILGHLGFKDVSSPTFALANIYESVPKINHLDLYRLESEEELESFEYEDYFYPKNSVTFIEWPERAGSYLPRDYKNIYIEVTGPESRKISLDNLEFGKKLGLIK